MTQEIQTTVEQTFTLWCWPYFQLRDSARPVLSGLSKAKAEEIVDREKDRAPGLLFIEPDAI